MCGIAGIITPNAEDYRENLQKMTDAIQHRGPDAGNHEFYNNAALGHRRLSIVDLSPTGSQPMFSDSGRECVVLNGEIYGFLDLKKKYSNYPYRGASDTELILAMYKEKGENLIDELPGMFAFAIWDENRQQLFCARDRFGEKPFYYAFGKNREFIFASEIKAILASGLIQPKVNTDALYHFLKYGYTSTYQSIYKNIFSLPPAHTLKFSEGKITTNRYYSIPSKDQNISLSEAKEEFEKLLNSAIQKQLIADVEVGSFLSGGLDSSTIVALVNKTKPNQTTISYGYSGEGSELNFAKEIAEKYRTNHIEIHEERGDIAADLLNISPYFDEPFADMSYTPQFKISRAAAKHIKVVLSGDVGDELFGGYSFYQVENQLKNHFSYENILAKAAMKLYSWARPISYVSQQNLQYENILDFHQNNVRNYFTSEEIAKLGIKSDYKQDYSFSPNPNSLNDIMRVDVEKYVPGNMLVKSDRMAMANSLEVRIPFLDIDFAEFCISLPDNLKISKENDKIILREAMGRYWTDTIRNRHKQGFGSDVGRWFKEKSMQELSANLMKNKNSKIFSFIDFHEAQSYLDGWQKEWNLLQLALWAENYKTYL